MPTVRIKRVSYKIEKSTRDNKKLMVVTPKGKLIHFGARSMQHYKDRTGIWAKLDHLDKERRDNYRTRAAGIRDKNNKLTYNNPESANFYSYWVLW